MREIVSKSGTDQLYTFDKRRFLLSLTKNPLTGLAIALLTTLSFVGLGFLDGYSVQSIIGFIIVAWLSAENGGNDVSKGIAPLVSSGAAGKSAAILYGAVVTAIGGILSIYISTKLLKLFTSGLIGADYAVTGSMAMMIAAGATLWVALATRFAWPVSTTHAIIGSILTVGFLSYGLPSVLWGNLVQKAVVPLLFGPVVGLGIAWLLSYGIRWVRLPRNVGKPLMWLSSGSICLVRSINDTPKIVSIALMAAAIGIGDSGQGSGSMFPLFLLITLAMAIGSMVKGFAVTELLSRKVTQLDEKSSLSALFTTTFLVIFASKLGLPVSTTHVSSSAIIGSNLNKGARSVNWKVVRDVALSWVVTIPGAGILAAVAYFIIEILL
jgi:inorganic phosphate transporter, PiT family